MTERKNPVTRFRLWLRTFVESVTIDRKYESVHYVRPNLESLEDRTLPSASAVDSLPVVAVASPAPVPSFAAVASYMTSLMSEWGQLIETAQQDVAGVWKAIGQGIAQELSFVQQQWDQLLGINSSVSNPVSAGAGQGPTSGSGSGAGTITTAQDGDNQPIGTARPLDGGGSGSGSGSGSSSYNALVTGQVWLDNNGDGGLDDGEMDYSGDKVSLFYQTSGGTTWYTLGSTTTNGNLEGNNYSIPVPLPDLGNVVFQIHVDLPPFFMATDPSTDSVIDAQGVSPIFSLSPGGVAVESGGMKSMNVTTNADDANGPIQNQITLRDAIETGNNGPPAPAITFDGPPGGSGVTGTISLQAALPDIQASYNIDGTQASLLAVSGANSYQVFHVQATSTIRGLTIENGYAYSGGGVYNAGTLTLDADTIENNNAANGGGIYNTGTLTLANGGLVNNSASGGGTSSTSGGGTSASMFNANAAPPKVGNGGGIFNSKGNLKLTNQDINNNKATGVGGGIYIVNSVVTLNGCAVSNNRATNGGGIFNAGGQGNATVNINNGTTIDYNIVTGGGGGVDNSFGAVLMTGGSIYENSAGIGGGIYTVNGIVHLPDVYLFANFANTGNGGGILENLGVVTLKGGTVQGNRANNGNGGGIYLMSGTLQLTNGELIGSGNTAIVGGGMYLTAGTTHFTGCTVGGNTATSKAAGVAYTTNANLNPPPPIPAANLTDNDDPGGRPVKV